MALSKMFMVSLSSVIGCSLRELVVADSIPGRAIEMMYKTGTCILPCPRKKGAVLVIGDLESSVINVSCKNLFHDQSS